MFNGPGAHISKKFLQFLVPLSSLSSEDFSIPMKLPSPQDNLYKTQKLTLNIVVTYPIGAKADILNVLFVISEPSPPSSSSPSHPQSTPMSKSQQKRKPAVAKASKAEAIEAFKSWHPTIRSIVDLLPDAEAVDSDETKALRWDIYDMHDHPAPYYTRGGVCLAGDAAHASTPHLGSGAGFGIEDALTLATVLEAVDKEIIDAGEGARVTETVTDSDDNDNHGEPEVAIKDESSTNTREQVCKVKKPDLCRAALAAYNDVRYERTQWLPGASREACGLFQWEGEAGRRGRDDPAWFGEEITRRFYHIWNYDIDGMVRDVLAQFRGRVGSNMPVGVGKGRGEGISGHLSM